MAEDRDLVIDKIAMFYAMEHSLDAKVVRNYVAHLAASDYGCLDGLAALHEHSDPRKAMRGLFFANAARTESAANFQARIQRFDDAHGEIVKRMKAARLLR